MSNLLSELEAVVGLAEKATPGPWVANDGELATDLYWADGSMVADALAEFADGLSDPPNAPFVAAAVNFLRTHHAELEAMARDAGKCWALHFLGPDDVVAAPSREAAEIVARNFNAYWDAHKDERGHDVRVVAEVIEWEHGCVEHAKSAAQHWPEYADLLETKAMHNSAREG